jgi:hypothetical protein
MTALSSAAVLHARIKHIMSLNEIKQTCTHIFSSKKETESIQNHHTTTTTQRTHIIAQTQYNVCRVNCRVHNPKEHSCLDINIAVESLSRPLVVQWGRTPDYLYPQATRTEAARKRTSQAHLNLIPIVVRYTSGIWAFLQSPILSPLESNQSEIPSAVQLGCHSFFQTLCPRISVSLSVCLSVFQQVQLERPICPKCSFFTLFPPNRSNSCDHELGMTNLPKMQLVPLSLPTGPIFAIKSLERVRNAASSFSLPTDPILAIKSLGCSHLSEIQLLPSLFQWFRFLRSRAWNVWSIRNAGSSLPLPTDLALAIKSLECLICPKCSFAVFQQIRFLRSRVWNVLICPKFSRLGDQELGMFWSVRNAASSLSPPTGRILAITSLECAICPKCSFNSDLGHLSGSIFLQNLSAVKIPDKFNRV